MIISSCKTGNIKRVGTIEHLEFDEENLFVGRRVQ
jgi:hypothetical protein